MGGGSLMGNLWEGTGICNWGYVGGEGSIMGDLWEGTGICHWGYVGYYGDLWDQSMHPH